MADAPTNGVKAGVEAAGGATSSVDGVPPSVLNTARQIALQTGGNPDAVSKFMVQQGYPQHAGEWCGDFAAAVVHASGGTPPPNSAAAGAWANFGAPRQGTPQPGDVAVMRGNDQRTGLPYTHVTFVDAVNPDGTFVGLGGNQGGGQLKRSVFGTSAFDFRAPVAGALAAETGPENVGSNRAYTFSLPANAPMGMGNNNPLNIKYYKGAEKDYPGLVGPSTNTDQGDPQMKFGSPEAGWNAAYNLLNKKYTGGMTTPNQIIAGKGGWTPGNTQAAANIAKAAGIGPDDDINFSDPAKAQAFMRALVTQEQGAAGKAYPDEMIAASIGGNAPAPSSAAPGSPAVAGAAPAADKPWWQKAFDAPTDANGNPIPGGKSPLQQAASALQGNADKGSSLQQFKQAQEDEAPQGAVRNQAGASPGARNTSPLGGALLPSVPQTYGQTLNSFVQPLTWSSAPPGAPQMPAAGLQGSPATQVPGMTLTSFRAPQGIGYGVDPNIGYGYG